MIQNITFQIQLTRLPFSKLGRQKILVGSRFLIPIPAPTAKSSAPGFTLGSALDTTPADPTSGSIQSPDEISAYVHQFTNIAVVFELRAL